MTRSGDSYRADLSDGRDVYLDGDHVDVATHPAFAGIVATMGRLVDVAADDALRSQDAAAGGAVAWWWRTPRSAEDLAARRRASELLAEETCGFVGRGPDHVASFFAGFVGRLDVFGPRSAALQAFWQQAALADSYVSYVIIPPSIDRARAVDGDDRSQVRVVDESPDGITVSGVQILGTGTALSDWLFVSCIPPLQPGQEDHALSFVVPVATEGLRIHCRKPYSTASSVYDAPFSTRFDETDAVVIFDEVFVPTDQVFVCRDIEATAAQFHATAAHTLGNLQAQIRLMVKLRFLVGLASRIIQVSGAGSSASALDALAELASLAASVEAHVVAAEHGARMDDYGVMVPDKRFLYSPMSRQADLYPRALHLLRELTSSQAIDLPSSVAALEHRDLIDHATSGGVDADERVKLYRLAWDVIGSEFAGRHHQYEMFYAGAPSVAKAHTRRTWRFDEAEALLDRTLSQWDRSTPLPYQRTDQGDHP
ncbi:MAG: 4-hydroxyphenylacetate 3-hydroxylase N-terminal domain-containing protein [Acidimicrobiales bacterium]